MADEKKKDEAKEPKPLGKRGESGKAQANKEPKPEAAAEAAPVQEVRKLVVETDGRNVRIVHSQLSVLELHEVGRQLMAL